MPPLEAIIHVDEFLFSALTPTGVQFRIQNLPPVKMKPKPSVRRVERLDLCVNSTTERGTAPSSCSSPVRCSSPSCGS